MQLENHQLQKLIMIRLYINIVLFFLAANICFAQKQIIPEIVFKAKPYRYKSIKLTPFNFIKYTVKQKIQVVQLPDTNKLQDFMQLKENGLLTGLLLNCTIKVVNRKTKSFIIFHYCNEVFSDFKEYNSSGILIVDGNFNCTDLKEGEWKYYDEHGRLASVGLYKNGKKIGKWQYYNSKGELIKEIQY